MFDFSKNKEINKITMIILRKKTNTRRIRNFASTHIFKNKTRYVINFIIHGLLNYTWFI